MENQNVPDTQYTQIPQIFCVFLLIILNTIDFNIEP